MRHRERVIEQTTGHVKTEQWFEDYRDDPVISAYSLVRDLDIVTSETTEVMDDVVTPRWHDLRASGGISNNPMTHVRTTIRDDIASIYIVSEKQARSGDDPDYEWGHVSEFGGIGTNSSAILCGNFGGYLDKPTYDQSPWLDLALTKAWSNVRLDEVQSLVMIGESQKTIASMVAIFGRLIKILKSIKRLDSRALKHELTGKELSNRYMELRYAIRPLMYDFNGTIAALKHEASKAQSRLTFRGHEHFTTEDSDIVNHANGNSVSNGARSFDVERTATLSFDVRAGVLAQLETVSSLPVWGLAQPIEAAWELVPFSFIVDWFFNVGNTIATWAPDFGLRPLASWTVSKEIFEKTFRIVRTYAEEGETHDWSIPTFHVNNLDGVYCSETVITTVRTPDPSRPIIPTLKVNLDVLKLIDLLIIVKYLVGK